MSLINYARDGACCNAQRLLSSATALLAEAYAMTALHDSGMARRIAEATELLDSVACATCEESMSGATRGGMAGWQVRRILSHIEANVGSSMPLPELAGLIGLSVAHFSRSFKASVGEAPQSYITSHRVTRAQSLLLTTNASLSEIALICGFSDQSHFSRQFRKHIGVTPYRWRREMRAAKASLAAGAARDPVETAD